MKTLAVGTALAAFSCLTPTPRTVGTSGSQITPSDSVAVLHAAWQALTSERRARRVLWLWAPSVPDTTGVIPLTAGITNALAQLRIPASTRRPAGDDTVVFTVTEWTGEFQKGRVELEFRSRWTTVLGSGARPCRTGSVNIERVQVMLSDGRWKAERMEPVMHGDDICVPLQPGARNDAPPA
jgi:hypothetical protein